MATPEGKTIKLSNARKSMVDYMACCRNIPTIHIERRINIGELAKVREQSNPKPGWLACFIKAYALAGGIIPQMRWSYLTFPYERIFEHTYSAATVAIEREVNQEKIVFGFRISQPETRSLIVIDQLLKSAREEQVEKIPAFRRSIDFGHWPKLIRRFLMWYGLNLKGSLRYRHFGTFGVSSIVAGGADLMTPQCPLSTMLTFGEIDIEQFITLRMGFDHRVMDGMAAARILKEVENQLKTTVQSELTQ